MPLTRLGEAADIDAQERTLSFAERLQLRYPEQRQQPSVESLEKVLVQALKTKDKDLLATVFQTTDETIIKKTVQKLSPTSILPLLQVTVEKFQSSPSSTKNLVLWIQAVTSAHLSFLVTIPNLAETLGPLFTLIQSRLSVYQDVLRLKGRLDLMVNQMDQQRQNSQLNVTSLEPASTYTEGHSEEDSFMSDSNESSSDDEEEDDEGGEASEESSDVDDDDEDDDDDDDASGDEMEM